MNEKTLADTLSAKFRLGLTGSIVPTKGGNSYAVRPTDIPPPNGFVIQVTTGWKSMEADFVPDTYAGDLVRAMGNSSPQARGVFASLVDAFEGMGHRIKLSINESVISITSTLPPALWNKFELNVRRLTDVAGASEEALQKKAEEITAACLVLVLTLLPLEEDDDSAMFLHDGGHQEGVYSRVTINRYERSPINRAACVAVHGSVCKLCGFDFGKIYGPLAHGYIEVHHLLPVSKMGARYIVDPVKDLVPLCSNCHAAVHRTDPPIELATLALIIAEKLK